MNILVTGARAPISIEWAARLKRYGSHRVIMADSMRLPLGRFSKNVDKYYCVRPPRQKPHEYISDIAKICIEEKINIVIPTCEEVFYLSALRAALPLSTRLFTDSIDKLVAFHDKFQFIELIKDSNVFKPKTKIIESLEEMNSWIEDNEDNVNAYIIKPCYCRFGAEVILNINPKTIPQHYPVVVQEKIIGEELCSYAIAVDGQLIAYSCYYPKYRAGPGAGIYFEPKENLKVLNFTRDFVAQNSFTGQIALDFICKNNGAVYPIECNPRGTSGLHLIPESMDFMDLIINPRYIACPTTSKPCQLKLPMWIYSLDHIKAQGLKHFTNDYKLATDVYEKNAERGLRFWQFISFFELIVKSFLTGGNLRKASTQDIQFDGNKNI